MLKNVFCICQGKNLEKRTVNQSFLKFHHLEYERLWCRVVGLLFQKLSSGIFWDLVHALTGKMLFVRIIENYHIDAYFRSG